MHKNLKQLQQKVETDFEVANIGQKKEKMNQLEEQMQQENFWDDQRQAKQVKQEYSFLQEQVQSWTELKEEIADLVELKQQAEDSEEMLAEIEQRTKQLWEKFEQLRITLLLDEEFDDKNAIVSIHSGSGGVEAQDWAEMLLRMLIKYCENQDWDVTLLEKTYGEEAGIKSATFKTEGKFAYGKLKSEDGTHRLVRISPFDSTNSRHTSFALVEVVPELEQSEGVELKDEELRIDTFMASKPGGQSVNTTESAVRITHQPTGITVSCQNEKSQHRNKETARKILRSKLQKYKKEKQKEKLEEIKGEYQSPEWGNQIRSYVLQPYHMVKDLRSEYETSDTESVLEGELEPFVESYLEWNKQQN